MSDQMQRALGVNDSLDNLLTHFDRQRSFGYSVGSVRTDRIIELLRVENAQLRSTIEAAAELHRRPIPAEVLRPDPDLMGSPEGDTRGLRELQDAVRTQSTIEGASS